MKTFERIYEIVAKIPKGKVMTYKQVAEIAGVKNPRVVGFAMRANKHPEKIPCHRVVGGNGALQGYAMGGVDKKKELLLREGVKFTKENTVDLERSYQSVSLARSHLAKLYYSIISSSKITSDSA